MITADFTGQVRRFMARVAPDDVPEFDAELRAALEQADGDHDRAEVRQVVLRWGGRAALRADPLTDEELAALERARAGDSRGLRVLQDDGTWRTL